MHDVIICMKVNIHKCVQIESHMTTGNGPFNIHEGLHIKWHIATVHMNQC